MQIFDLDPRKRVIYDALKGIVQPISSIKTGALTATAAKAAALLAFKIALIAAVIGGAVIVKDNWDADAAESIRDKILSRLDERRAEDKENTTQMSSWASASTGAYYVVKVTDTNIYSVRAAQHFNEAGQVQIAIPYASFRHAGNSSANARLTIIGKRYPNAQAATKALGGMIDVKTLKKPPLAAGKIAKMGGDWVTVDDLGAVDFKVLYSMMRQT